MRSTVSVCPCCNRPLPRPRAVAAVPVVDVATLSDDALREYRKRTAPGKDLEFFAAVPSVVADGALSAACGVLANDCAADGSLTRGVNRAAFYGRLTALQAIWRRAANARERAARIAAAVVEHYTALALARGDVGDVEVSDDAAAA